MLGSDPIVLVADTICIELEEPEVIKPAVPKALEAPPPPPKSSQGFMDRIIDNIKFELKELRIKLKLRGKDKRFPTFDLVVKDIEIKSTNAKWQVVDLRQVHTVDKNGHVIMYKEIDIGRFTFSVTQENKPVAVLNQLPIRVRTKTKKAYFRGPTINHAIYLDVLEELSLRLHSKQFKVLQDAVDALLECMGRSAPPPSATETTNLSTPINTSTPTQIVTQTTEPTKSSYTGSLWGRFANVIGSYAGYGGVQTESTTTTEAIATATPQATPTKSTPPEGNADFDTQLSDDSAQGKKFNGRLDDDNDDDDDSDEEYRDAESEVSLDALADKTSKSVANDDDITHTSYTIGLQSGRISIFDFILEEKGIAELKFEKLRCQFVPNIKAVRPKICFDQLSVLESSSPAKMQTLENELVEQTQISIAIESYGLNQLDPGADRHPDFTYLLKRVADPSSDAPSLSSSIASTSESERPTLTLDFVKFPDWKDPTHLRREAQLTIDSVAILADLRPWERLWNFFFGGQKGEKFAQYMQDNLGQMLEAALNEQVHFKFDCRRPTFLLPPFASKFIGKPHLASKVLRLHAHSFTVKSLPIESSNNDEFARGLFTMSEFPAMKDLDFSHVDMAPLISSSDIHDASSSSSSTVVTKTFKYPKRYDERDPLVMTERKFECNMTGMWIDIQADPTSAPERVLKPFDMNAQMIRREFQTRSSPDGPLQMPRWTPQLDGFVSLTDIGLAITPSQYSFLLGIWSERLAWNPNQVTPEMLEAMKMEKLLEAAQSGASSSNTASIALNPADDPPLLLRVRVFVPTVNLQLLERAVNIDKNSTKHPSPSPSPVLSTHSPAAFRSNASTSTIPHSTVMAESDDGEVQNDSPSSTIQYGDDGDNMTEHTSSSPYVILSEMEFSEISYILESHGERSITKVSSPHFVVTSPVHADSPFSKLVGPLLTPLTNSKDMSEPKPALLVRMEKFKDEAAAAKVLSEQQNNFIRPNASSDGPPHQPLLLGDPLDDPVDENDIYLHPTSAASPVMNVRLHGMQVCWIYTTLAEVQVFFTRGDEVPAEMRGVTNIPYINVIVEGPNSSSSSSIEASEDPNNAGPTSSSAAQSSASSPPVAAPSLGMNWAVIMTESELVVIETPDTPECMPMGLLDARVERRGVSADENQFDFFGNCIISSEMWQADIGSFARTQLTTPFNMEVAYIQERNPLTDKSSTNMEMLIDNLQLTINRKQLIMVQNILDNQMADIRDVSTKREAEKVADNPNNVPDPIHLASSSTSIRSSSGMEPQSNVKHSGLASSIGKLLKAPLPEKQQMMKITLPRNSNPPERGMVTSASGTKLNSSTSNLSASSIHAEAEFNPRAASDDDFNPRSSSSLRSSSNELPASFKSRGSRPGSANLSFNLDAYKESTHLSSDSTSSGGPGSSPMADFVSDTLVKALRSRFQVGIQKMNLKLLDPAAQPIASIRLDDFLYSTENWSDVSVMLIEGGLLTVTTMNDPAKGDLVSPYATILQPRLANSIGGKDAVVVTHAPTLVPVVESFMPVISEQTGPGLPAALQAKLARELKQANHHPNKPLSSTAAAAGPRIPLPNAHELDTIGDSDVEHHHPTAPLMAESSGHPIQQGTTNYGSISASPMINSFVMLSSSSSGPGSEKHDYNASAPNSSKQPASFKFGTRRKRRSIQQASMDEIDLMPTLSSSISAGNLHSLGEESARLSQTYDGSGVLNTALAKINATNGTHAFATPSRKPSGRQGTPFPASGRDPHSISFAQSLQPGLQTGAFSTRQSTNGRKSALKVSSDDSSSRTPTKLSSQEAPSSISSNKRNTITRSVRKKKKNALWTEISDGSDSETDVPVVETEAPVKLADGRMFSLKFENIQRDFKGVREEKHAKWMSRWIIGFAPFDIVYDAKAFAQVQDFFALMAEHKNLRHRYQNFQAEVLKVYKEQGGLLNESGLEQIQQVQAASQSNAAAAAAAAAAAGPIEEADDGVNRVALNILISGPRVSIPQPLEEESKSQNKTLLSVLEFSLDSIRVHNAANASTKNDNLSQTKILVTGARCFMKTIELGVDEELPIDVPASAVVDDDYNPFSMDILGDFPKQQDHQQQNLSASTISQPAVRTLGAIALQTQELARPINAKIVIEIKPVGASGRPFMHVSCDIDMFAAMISIKRYQLLVSLVNDYILSFFKRTRINPNDDGLSPEFSAFLGGSAPSAQQSNDIAESTHMDKIIEVNVKTINLTVISDYMAELELVYLHLTDFNASMGLYDHMTDLTLAGRLEVLINNLNFMIPERFVDELNFVVHLHSEKLVKSNKNKEATKSNIVSPLLSPPPPHKINVHDAMEDLRSSMNLKKSLNARNTSDIDESVPDISIMVEPDDELVSLDDQFPDDDMSMTESEVGFGAENTRDQSGGGATTTTLDIAILDGLKFTLTQDLMRHLVELYQLYSHVQEDTSGSGDQSLLHFQYVLVNRTDLPIRHWQTNTDDAKVLKPGDETYFTFSNPYQLKRLEMELVGWTHNEQAFSPEEIGSMVFHLTQTVGEVESHRDLLVSIQPKGLKRYVEFLTTHHVVNDTDKILLLRLIHTSTGAESTNEYMIAPHTTVPISCSETWPVDFSVAFADGSWEFSRPLPISKDRPSSITDTIKLLNQNGRDERWLLCTTTREPYSIAEGVQMVTLHFAAPVVMENLCVFPLEYYFPSMLPRRPRANPSQNGVQQRNVYQAYHEDEDRLADSIAAVLPANSTTYFYFDTFRHRELCCRLVGYSLWSGRIQIERVQQSSLELYKTPEECMEGEKDDILISVFIYGRHHDFARRLAFNTQFLFVNDTDMLLFARQQNTLPMTQIAARQMTPFSWVRGSSKMLSVNMGNTAWSPGIDISTDSFQRLEIKVPNFDVSYMFLMESHTLDGYSRVVAWRSWFHIRNHSSYDLKFYLKGAKKALPDSNEDLPSFELDEVDDDDDEYDTANLKSQRRRNNKKKQRNAGYALLSDDNDDGSELFDEEAATGTSSIGSIQSDVESPMMRNTVFGNVHVSDHGWIVIPRHSNTTSGLCPDVLGLSIAKDHSNQVEAKDSNATIAIKLDDGGTETAWAPGQQQSAEHLWSAVEIPTTSQCQYSVPITSLADPRIFKALDISVTTDEKGLYITLTDNKDPPFIINNEMPFAVKLRRQPKTHSSGPDSGKIARPGSARITNIITNSAEEYVIEPNSTLNLFSAGLGDEDDFEYRACVLSPEEYKAVPTQQHGTAATANKHGRKTSGGNQAGLGLSPSTIHGHRRVPSGSTFLHTYHGDLPDIISPTATTASNRATKLDSFIGLTTEGGALNASPSLPTINDEEDDDLMSAMDGVSDTEEGDLADEDLDPSNASSSAVVVAPPSSKRSKRRNRHAKVNPTPQLPIQAVQHRRTPSGTGTPPLLSPASAFAASSGSGGTPPLTAAVGSRTNSLMAEQRKTLTLLPLQTSSPELRRGQGHVRSPSGSAAGVLSPRATLAMDAMDAFSSAIGHLGDPSSSSHYESQVYVSSLGTGGKEASITSGVGIGGGSGGILASSSRNDGRLVRQYRQYFSSSMDAWSQPFTLRSALEFSIEWQDESDRMIGAWNDFSQHSNGNNSSHHPPDSSSDMDDIYLSSSSLPPHMGRSESHGSKSAAAIAAAAAAAAEEGTPNMILVAAQPQGKTRVVKLTLPDIQTIDTISDEESHSGSKKEVTARRVMKVDMLLPEIQVLMLTTETRDPAASIRLHKVQLEVSQYSNLQHSIFFVIQGAEANTLSPTAEYPVLFGVDRRALHGAHPRFMEFLVEWNVREQRTFIDYIGLRVLPFVLQIDSEILDSFEDLKELLGPLYGGGDSGNGAGNGSGEQQGSDGDVSSSAKESTLGPSNSTLQQQHIRKKTALTLHNESSSNVASSSSPSAIVPPSASSSIGNSALSSLASMDLASPETIAEYGAVGRTGLGDSGSFGGGYFYSGAADRELTDNNPAAPRNRLKLKKLLKLYTEIQYYQFVLQNQLAQDNFLYVGRLEIFPLRVTLSIGTNTKHWPVIAEAQMQLPSFSRNELSESLTMLFSSLGSAYSNLVWAEVYQIIGNLDAIASPLQNLRKLATGLKDFFKLPLEGLVLDDTPGAYLVGLWYGTASLVLNWTDFLLTVMMKSFQTLSWVTQVICLDEDYQKVKDRVARQHPTNVVYGMGQGVRECARGLFESVAGFVTLPMRGIKRNGAAGFFSGAGKAILGLPLKPIGGVFDLFSKTFEGLLQTMGRGYLLQERAVNSLVRQQLPEGEIRESIQKFITMRDQRILIIDDARFMRHGRPLERYLVLTFHALYIINVNKLHFDDYSPKKIPIGLIKNLVVPVTPETQMVVRLHQGQHLWKQDQFLFIVPDRKHFILKMAARFGIKTLEVAKLEKLI
jgi:hypothetical protein